MSDIDVKITPRLEVEQHGHNFFILDIDANTCIKIERADLDMFTAAIQIVAERIRREHP